MIIPLQRASSKTTRHIFGVQQEVHGGKQRQTSLGLNGDPSWVGVQEPNRSRQAKRE